MTAKRLSGGRPTLQSIADRAGVSHQTVSNVLNAPDKVAETTRKRVLEVIRAENYHINESARSLARASTQLVSFHLGHRQQNADSLLEPFMRELALEGRAHGFRVVLDVAGPADDEQIASFEELLARRAVDAIVIPETHAGDARPQWLASHGIPSVAFGRPWAVEGATNSWVDVDGHHGMKAVAEHLVERGITRAAYVGPELNGGMEDDRFEGLVDGLRGSGVGSTGVERLVVQHPSQLWAVLPEFMERVAPTALTCRDDSFAFEAVQILRSIGLEAGRDVAVTGYDDSDLARRCWPKLTSVSQPLRQVAVLTWQSLMAQLGPDDVAPLQELIQPTLVVRASSSR